ncbi:hypothetical protein [Metapseudomonas resinovorans]|uniref:Uncharacterized protein n=1 Tax=Metapseudomonas resinovorans NBRC 106553 TaxID=1245471 RepID=S6BF46_METRE|nr:hypothetical protein [Pseudomonas resinovorans]BAN47679.1 hypothetical protein PCA10_19470 [Pseudomonas resinovorans NBRC 106553]
MKAYYPIAESIAEGTFPDCINASHKDFKLLKEMYEGGYVAAVDASDDDGGEFMEIRLLPAGRKLLDY